jgi:hypothetical protein
MGFLFYKTIMKAERDHFKSQFSISLADTAFHDN